MGFTPDQTVWLAHLPVKRGDTSPPLGCNELGKGEAGAMKETFHTYFLPYLLNEQGFFSKSNDSARVAADEFFEQVEDNWQALNLPQTAASDIEDYLDLHCSKRANFIYPDHLKSLIEDRNTLVDAVKALLSDSDTPPWRVLVPLDALKAFDDKYGLCIRRDPAKVGRFITLVEAKADISPAQEASEPEQGTQLTWAERLDLHELKSQKLAREEFEENETEELHCDNQLDVRVELYLDNHGRIW